MSDLVDQLCSLPRDEWRWIVREMSAYYRMRSIAVSLPPRKSWDNLRAKVNRKRTAYERALAVVRHDSSQHRKRDYMRVYMARRRDQ